MHTTLSLSSRLSSVLSLSEILDAVRNAPFATVSEEERVVLSRMLVAVERSLAIEAYPNTYRVASDLLRTVAERVEQDANVHVLAGNETKQAIVREIARACSLYAERLVSFRRAA